MLLMMLGVAMAIQDAPALTPGACHHAGERFARFAPLVQEFLENDATAEREGRETKLTAEQRENVANALARDRRALAVVQERYADVVPTEADRALIAGMEGADVGDYVRSCGEAPA